MMRRVLVLFTLLSLAFAGTALPALGQEVLDAGVTQIDFAPASSGAPTGDVDEYAEAGRMVLEAVDKGDGWMVAALGLSLIIALLRSEWGVGHLPDGPPLGATGRAAAILTQVGRFKRYIQSGEGAIVLALAGSLVGGAVATMTSGVPFGWVFIRASLKTALVSMGGVAGLIHTVGSRGAESRAERQETTAAVKLGLTPAPPTPPA